VNAYRAVVVGTDVSDPRSAVARAGAPAVDVLVVHPTD
jgi:hypothetical protein